MSSSAKLIQVREYKCRTCKLSCPVRDIINPRDPEAQCPFGKWLAANWREKNLPPVSEQALNFLGAGFRVMGALVQQKPVRVSDEVFSSRKEICLGCEWFRESDGRCAKCGCSYKLKLKLATEHCPIGKW